MAKLLKGKEVSDSIIQNCAAKVSEKITEGELAPKLAVLSIGDDGSNNSYLKGIAKKSSEAGVLYEVYNMEEECSAKDVLDKLEELNNDDKINGILLMRPLPDYLKSYEPEICEAIAEEKDIDAARQLSVAGAYLGNNSFAPCTAQACVNILHHYNIPVQGKRVVVIGRSLVVGKPVAQMLLNENATVTTCHSKSENLEKITRQADIVIVATGTAKKFGAKYFNEGQTVIDAGINWDEKAGKLCGDVDFEAVEPKVSAITPVPGGVGTVTSAVLISHLV